ncbi:MAG: YceI family protein [Ginsengibacter sp.]
MKNRIFFAIILVLATSLVNGQDKYFTKSGKISFFSATPLEDIAAVNSSAVIVLDTKANSLQFSVLIKGFEFENEEMQAHFNADYLESDKYPKAEFKGHLVNTPAIDFKKSGTYPVQVKGSLTMHGVTKEVQSAGTIKVDGSSLKASSTFNIQVADFDIVIPKLVRDKVAKTVKIAVDTSLEPLKG